MFAVRAYGFKSWGSAPGYTFFGGNSEMRGYEYREFLGHKGFYTNAELRFPLIHAMATPIGILGGIRGVFFFNLGGAGLEGLTFKVWDKNTFVTEPLRDESGVIIRPGTAHRGVPARRRARVLRHRPRNLRARLPGALRLVLPHAVQQGVGGLPLRQQRAVPQGAFTVWIGYDF